MSSIAPKVIRIGVPSEAPAFCWLTGALGLGEGARVLVSGASAD